MSDADKQAAILAGVREQFRAAPAWARPDLPKEPTKAWAVTLQVPGDPGHEDALFRYYQPAGEHLAVLCTRMGATSADQIDLSLGLSNWPESVTVRAAWRA